VLAISVVFLALKHFLAALRGETNLKEPKANWPRGLSEWAVRRICKTEVERAGFIQAWSLTMRDKVFMRAGFPVLAMLLAPVLGNMASATSLGSTAVDLTALLAPYFTGLLAAMVIKACWLTETPNARWIYRLLPEEVFGEHLRGVIYALLIRMVLPSFLIVILAQLFLMGDRVPSMTSRSFSWESRA
jgi:hypothetical protein